MRKLVRAGRFCLLTPVLLVGWSCGGSPTAPPLNPPPVASIAPGTVLVFRSGEDNQAIAGASVAVQGQSSSGPFTQSYTTDASGSITLDRAVFLSPTPLLDIAAPGFVARATFLRSNETSLSLWPALSSTGLDEEFSSTLVYSSSQCPALTSGAAPLRRSASSVAEVRVVFSSSLQDGSARTAHEEAIARLNAALGGTPNYAFSTGPAGENVFTAEIDPNHPTCTAGPEPLRASTVLMSRNGEIVGGRLVYCTVEAARSARLVLHELGHTAGMYHSSSQRDVMYCSSGRPVDFSSRERLALKLMRQRRAGNRWPDTDRDALAPLRVTETETIACYEALRR